MSEISGTIGPFGPVQKKTEEQVRSELLSLASALIEKAKGASSIEDARTYAETAAVVFGAASARMNDVPPDRG